MHKTTALGLAMFLTACGVASTPLGEQYVDSVRTEAVAPPTTTEVPSPPTAVRRTQIQVTDTLPPPPPSLTPQEIVNGLPYEHFNPAPAMEAFRIVAGVRGWSAEKIAAWSPFAEDVMRIESAFCWNRLRGDEMVPYSMCVQVRQGPHTDAGFGQVTPIAGYRSDLWMCQDHGICSKWEIIQDPWHSMYSMVLLMERDGKFPWCYDARARRLHDCGLAPS